MLTGLALEELDVVFATAHIQKRRPTLIAAEMPKLTDHQVQVLTDRYDIHGGAMDNEAGGTYGDAPNSGSPDTTLPPTHASDLSGEKKGRHEPNADGTSTRVGSFDADTTVAGQKGTQGGAQV
jgi:hypothetical protein